MNCEMFIVLAQKKVLLFRLKSTIIFIKKYYRFMKKVLSFSVEDNIWLKGKCYL